MLIEEQLSISSVPREILEQFAVRASRELRELRRSEKSNDLVTALASGFAGGVLLAVGGFMTGALLR
jgi:hypothetical protein